MTSPDLSSTAPRTAPSVQVVAHRGSSDALPEHTLAAYRRALEEGADAVECDVRVTADGHLVCVHDRRIGRVSNGRGTVSAMTLAELEAYDFGAWKTGRPSTDPELRGVLTLERLLELVVDCGRPVDLAIETKHPVRFRGRVEAELLRMLERFKISGTREGDRPSARIMSFSSVALNRVAVTAPDHPRVFLIERLLPLLGRLREGRPLPGGARIAGPGIDLVRARPDLVPRLRELGHEVHVWTVDEPADVDLCLELGVSAIITNKPAQVLAQLGR
ncbi:glycerophosphodiester phosphodiesterase family protein [Streptomyces sp. SP17BM10]|uniref:glycerophosphodiester phosphodiesterase family protein n=1 Tax=Streptomyces sp. SP17BM10 TaxID=3002530 RepID=UPI002E77A616|nr:glycerophosphodiester phosphodiesterase family protein [Streptomyces sp. SP17BM10]MEE1783923.1 glycerophosphodiester phosphodiesterase family protein [Streptomyces sp. SP17BM10]